LPGYRILINPPALDHNHASGGHLWGLIRRCYVMLEKQVYVTGTNVASTPVWILPAGDIVYEHGPLQRTPTRRCSAETEPGFAPYTAPVRESTFSLSSLSPLKLWLQFVSAMPKTTLPKLPTSTRMFLCIGERRSGWWVAGKNSSRIIPRQCILSGPHTECGLKRPITDTLANYCTASPITNVSAHRPSANTSKCLSVLWVKIPQAKNDVWESREV
jgi:hypothetical protein